MSVDRPNAAARALKRAISEEFRWQGVPNEFLDHNIEVRVIGDDVFIVNEPHGVHIKSSQPARILHHYDKMMGTQHSIERRRGVPGSPERKRSNMAFAGWCMKKYGHPPTISDFANETRWAMFFSEQASEDRRKMQEAGLKGPDLERLRRWLGRDFELISEANEPMKIRTDDGCIYSYDAVYAAVFKHNADRLLDQVAAYHWGAGAPHEYQHTGTRTGRIPNETEGQETMTMTRAELEAMQEAAARQMAQAQQQLAKYEAFPTEAEVLAIGDVIRFQVEREWKRNVPQGVNFHVAVDGALARGYIDGHRLPPGNYAGVITGVDTETTGQPREQVKQTYTYVALHVDGKWYGSFKSKTEPKTYDDLLKYFVDNGVESFQVYGQPEQSFGAVESEPQPATEAEQLAETKRFEDSRRDVAEALPRESKGE